MKKIIIIFFTFSMFFLIWCKENIQEHMNIDNEKIKCNSDMKLWKNKTYNFSMCLTNGWWELNLYSWNISSLSDISDNSEVISDNLSNEITLLWYSKNFLWKYDKKYYFWNKEIIEHYDINGVKNTISNYNYYLKIWDNKYYGFWFDKKTDEIKAIINSIKVLEEF